VATILATTWVPCYIVNELSTNPATEESEDPVTDGIISKEPGVRVPVPVAVPVPVIVSPARVEYLVSNILCSKAQCRPGCSRVDGRVPSEESGVRRVLGPTLALLGGAGSQG